MLNLFKKGDRGSEIKELQALLINTGHRTDEQNRWDELLGFGQVQDA